MLVAKIGLFPIFLAMFILGSAPSLAGEVEVTPVEMQRIRAAEQERVAAIESVYDTVLSILGEKDKGSGSGVVFDPTGLALTNHHVVAAVGKKGKAGLSDGKTYDWNLVGTDPAGDIAIIQLHGRDKWPAAKLGDSTGVRTGDWVMAMGNPFALADDHTPTVTLGIVSGVHRYQGGGMVYGNCIQVDSAINPGNSGGPLMNMQGEVIGINGRAAFAERGRVSVGVGFAVSAEQVRNFIPDLMASKVAQHGTLDAQFGMRNGQVICESINLDSRAARAGLQLGDRLISINGAPVETANELANRLAMLPTDWPVHVSYEHEGKPFEFSIRLSALVFTSSSRSPAEKEDELPEKAPEKDEDEGKDKPKSKPRKRAGLPQLQPGALLSVESNRTNAKRVFEQWQHTAISAVAAADPVAIEWANNVQAAGKAAAKTKSSFTTDGRFLFENDVTRIYRGSKGFFKVEKAADPEPISINDALDQPEVLAVAMQAARYNRSIFDELGEPALDGGDYVGDQPAFRLRFDEKTKEPLFVWLSLASPHRLLKAGFDKDGTLARPAVMFSEPVDTKPFKWARKRKLVTGVRSRVEKTWTATDAKVTDVPEVLRDDDDSK